MAIRNLLTQKWCVALCRSAIVLTGDFKHIENRKQGLTPRLTALHDRAIKEA